MTNVNPCAILDSRKGKEAAHMEAQTGKLFRLGDEVVHVVEAVELQQLSDETL